MDKRRGQFGREAGSAAGRTAAAMRRLARLKRFEIMAAAPDASGRGALGRAGCQISEITEENLGRVGEFSTAAEVDTLRGELQGGHRGWYVLKDGQVAGYGFLAVAVAKSQTVRGVVIYPGEAAGMHFYIRPEFRGRWIASALWLEIRAIASTVEGVHTVLGWTSWQNRASRKLQAHSGMKPLGQVWVLEILGRPVLRWARGCKVKR